MNDVRFDPYLLFEKQIMNMDVGLPDIVEWAEREFYVEGEDGVMRPIRLLPHQRRILRDITRVDEGGRFIWREIIYSAPKKSGKTTVAALFGLWYGLFESRGNEIYVVANDLEQSKGRVYTAMWKALWANDAYRDVVGGREKPGREQTTITLPNMTTITALANDYAGSAGSNHGLTLWDELWGYMSERARRLWDELTPVPTRKNSLRFVATYAGFKGESDLLWERYEKYVLGVGVHSRRLYEEGFTVDGEEYDWDLPVYVNEEDGVYVYWDHSARMPWQDERYYAQQRQALTDAAFRRLHLNQWVEPAEAFIQEREWARCEVPVTDRVWDGVEDLPVVVAVDASVRRDLTAMVGVSYDAARDVFFVRDARAWKPGSEFGMDIKGAVVRTLRDWMQRYRVVKVVYDPYQLHAVMYDLRFEGFPVEEFGQVKERSISDQMLFTVIRSGKLVTAPYPELREHVLAARAKELSDGKLRIVKPKDDVHVDLAVALSMAVYGAYRYVSDELAKVRRWKDIAFLHV